MADNSFSLPVVHLADFEPVAADIIALMPASLVNKQMIVPLKKSNGVLIVAVPRTDGVLKPEGLALVVGCPVELVLAPAEEIIDFVKRYYAGTPAPARKSFVIPQENIVPAVESIPILIDRENTQDQNETLAIVLGGDLTPPPMTEPVDQLPELEPDSSYFNSETAALIELEPPKQISSPELKSTMDQRREEAIRQLPVLSEKTEKLVLDITSSASGVAPELLKMISAAVISRASEVLINVCRDKTQMRQRIRGIYVPFEGGRDGLNPSEVTKILSWLKEVGEKQSAEGLEWTEVRKELKIGEDLTSVALFLSESKDSKVLTARIRSQKESLFSPSTWGMDPSQIKIFTEFLEKKQGFILFAGAEREGLTGNLHACAKHVATPKKHVIAVEPAMESWLSGIDQYFSKGNPGLFAQLLQIAFKHAPDVLIANPLERKDHFEICLAESLKGRLVLGRCFAADCADALVQMASMGVEPYLVGSAVTGVLSKRTLRLNCPVCQIKDPTAKSQARELGIPDAMQPGSFFMSKGCESCSGTGFNGETDIFELLVMTTELRNIFNKDVRVESIRSHIKSSGLLTLRQVALHKAINGQTSLAEVVRTTPK